MRVVRQCRDSDLITSETVHEDTTLNRADVRMDALVSRHLDAVDAAAAQVDDGARLARSTGKFKKPGKTDL